MLGEEGKVSVGVGWTRDDKEHAHQSEIQLKHIKKIHNLLSGKMLRARKFISCGLS
jgi:hypothetical protein